MSNGWADGGLAVHQDCPARHLLGLDEVHHDPGGLPRLVLAHQPAGHLQRLPRLTEAKPLDVAMGGDALALGLNSALHFLDLHLGGARREGISKNQMLF